MSGWKTYNVVGGFSVQKKVVENKETKSELKNENPLPQGYIFTTPLSEQHYGVLVLSKYIILSDILYPILFMDQRFLSYFIKSSIIFSLHTTLCKGCYIRKVRVPS